MTHLKNKGELLHENLWPNIKWINILISIFHLFIGLFGVIYIGSNIFIDSLLDLNKLLGIILFLVMFGYTFLNVYLIVNIIYSPIFNIYEYGFTIPTLNPFEFFQYSIFKEKQIYFFNDIKHFDITYSRFHSSFSFYIVKNSNRRFKAAISGEKDEIIKLIKLLEKQKSIANKNLTFNKVRNSSLIPFARQHARKLTPR